MNRLLTMFLCAGIALTACKKKEEPEPNNNNNNNPTTTATLKLSIAKLHPLPSQAQYEGWIIVDGQPVSTGTFTVSEAGVLSKTTFTMDRTKLSSATAFIVSIEPNPDSDPATPTKTHILAGDFNGNAADLGTIHASALGTEFATAFGSYILATPTTTTDTDELEGIWFVNHDTINNVTTKGLFLPPPPDGWIYEGWAVSNNALLSTGKFSDPEAADLGNPYSGTDAAGPDFPGEDFIQNPPQGINFPYNLTHNGQTFITLEPNPDHHNKPHPLRILFTDIPATGKPLNKYNFTRVAHENIPFGEATR